jgi:hypothetical protein
MKPAAVVLLSKLDGAPAMMGRGVVGQHSDGEEGLAYRDVTGAIQVGNRTGVHPMDSSPGLLPPVADLDGAEHLGPLRLAFAYRAEDGMVIVRQRTNVSDWSYTNLSVVLTIAPAVGNPVVSYDRAGTRLFVAYATADGHLHVLMRDTDGDWGHTDVTATAGP